MALFNLLSRGVKKLTKNDKGQAMVEYGLIIALIAIVVIAALVILGPKIKDMFDSISDNF